MKEDSASASSQGACSGCQEAMAREQREQGSAQVAASSDRAEACPEAGKEEACRDFGQEFETDCWGGTPSGC